MHFSLISVAILVSVTTTCPHPLSTIAERNEPNSQRARPVQQFFKKVLDAWRPTTTPVPSSSTKRISVASSYHSHPEYQEIPNFIDFSTYLLDSFASNNNTAIKFTYMQPNASAAPALRGNYSVISFLVPHNETKKGEWKGIFSFLNSMRLPWNQPPTNTVYSQFPPFLENFVQQLQSSYSIFKYTDESRVNNTIVMFADDGSTDNSESTQSDDGIDTTTDYQYETTTEAFLDTTTDLQDDESDITTQITIATEMKR